jgi:hypothetical protein
MIVPHSFLFLIPKFAYCYYLVNVISFYLSQSGHIKQLPLYCKTFSGHPASHKNISNLSIALKFLISATYKRCFCSISLQLNTTFHIVNTYHILYNTLNSTNVQKRKIILDFFSRRRKLDREGETDLLKWHLFFQEFFES